MKKHFRRLADRSKRAVIILATFTVFVCVYLLANAARLKSRQLSPPALDPIQIDQALALSHLSDAIQLPTVSHRNRAKNNASAYRDFQKLLESTYPTVTENLNKYTGKDFGDPDNASLLYQWPGSTPKGSAVLLMAHYDVVPVEQTTLSDWEHPPFSGEIEEGYLWGRGALDDKCAVIAIMEACERLIQEGFRPECDVYLAFGHDEEAGGKFGNRQIAQWMRNAGIRLEVVIDEGGGIYCDVPGLKQPAALIGIAEKGYLNITMTVQLETAGHASIPPRETAIGIMASAITKLEKTDFPVRVDGGISRMLDYLGPEMSFFNRVAIGNQQWFQPFINRQFSSTPAGNAALRTTMVPTMLEAGFTENALPATAKANLHLRIQPGESVESSLKFVSSIIDDERVKLHLDQDLQGKTRQQPGYRQPSRISSDTSSAFTAMHRTIKQVFPEVAVAPFFVVASTDSAHYDDPALSKDVYRFTPWKLDQKGVASIHGINEKVGTGEFVKMIQFYEQLIMNLTENKRQ